MKRALATLLALALGLSARASSLSGVTMSDSVDFAGQKLVLNGLGLREKYFISGEINTKVADMSVIPGKLKTLAARYADAHTYEIDGFSAEYPDLHFNVRASNTEPLLRLNLEATTAEMMERKRDEVLALIRQA